MPMIRDGISTPSPTRSGGAGPGRDRTPVSGAVRLRWVTAARIVDFDFRVTSAGRLFRRASAPGAVLGAVSHIDAVGVSAAGAAAGPNAGPARRVGPFPLTALMKSAHVLN